MTGANRYSAVPPNREPRAGILARATCGRPSVGECWLAGGYVSCQDFSGPLTGVMGAHEDAHIGRSGTDSGRSRPRRIGFAVRCADLPVQTAHRPRHAAPGIAGTSLPCRIRRATDAAAAEDRPEWCECGCDHPDREGRRRRARRGRARIEDHRQRRRRLRQHRPCGRCGRRCHRHQHPGRPRPGECRSHLRPDPGRHQTDHRRRPPDPVRPTLDLGAADARRPRPQRRRHLGILGYGRIGRAVARRALAFDMRVLATSRSAISGTVDDGVTFVDLPTLLADSDVVSVHTPLTKAHPASDRRDQHCAR